MLAIRYSNVRADARTSNAKMCCQAVLLDRVLAVLSGAEQAVRAVSAEVRPAPTLVQGLPDLRSKFERASFHA